MIVVILSVVLIFKEIKKTLVKINVIVVTINFK